MREAVLLIARHIDSEGIFRLAEIKDTSTRSDAVSALWLVRPIPIVIFQVPPECAFARSRSGKSFPRLRKSIFYFIRIYVCVTELIVSIFSYLVSAGSVDIRNFVIRQERWFIEVHIPKQLRFSSKTNFFFQRRLTAHPHTCR